MSKAQTQSVKPMSAAQKLVAENEALRRQVEALQTPVAQPVVAQDEIADAAQKRPFDADNIQEHLNKMLASIKHSFGIEVDMPSWKRVLAATFLSLSLAAGAGYGIGYIASMLMVGCFTLTGSVFLMYTILVLAVLLSFYAGMKIGQKVGNYVLSGQIDKDFVAAKNKVSGFFKREPKEVKIAFVDSAQPV